MPILSVRIGLDWRAVCVRSGDKAIWYFIGSHADYDRLIKTPVISTREMLRLLPKSR